MGQRIIVLEAIPPNQRTGQGTLFPASLYCGVGVDLASNSIVVDLPQNRLVGAGFTDLHSERPGFGFATKNRRLLDPSAISTLRYDSLLGTLTNPRISLEPDGGPARPRLPSVARKHLDSIPEDLDRLECIASID